MWHFAWNWCSSWRRRDVLITVLASLVMLVGIAPLADDGAGVLLPLLLGMALLWPTPLSRNPFDSMAAPTAPKPHVPPWERDARRRDR